MPAITKYLNLDTDPTLSNNSDQYVASQKALKTYIDGKIQTVNDATLTIQKNSTTIDTFTANASSDVTVNIAVPTTTSDLTNDSDFITSSALDDYQTKITSTAKLSSDLVDDTNHTNKFVTSSEKSTWSGKQDSINDLSDIRTGAGLGATAVQPGDNISTLTNDAGYLSEVAWTDIEDVPSSFTPSAHTHTKNQITDFPTIPTVTDTYSASGSDATSGKAVAQALGTLSIPTKTSDLTNDSNFITGITSSDVTTALGYTPYNSTNPNGYQANVIETVKVNGSALTPANKIVDVTVPTKTSDLTNDDGFITGITSLDVTTALGFTPYDSSNPNGYTTNVGTVTSVNNVNPVNGNVTLSIPTVDQTYSDTSANAQSGKAVKSAIDAAISSVYKPAGSVAFASLPTPAKSVEGNVYNITDAFTTTTDFVEGAGKSYPAGTNVVVINTTGTTYKFDVLSGMVDLSGYVPTSRTVNGKALSSNISLTASDVSAVASNTAITGATKCKITYDSKGLVTAGADLSASDIPDISDTYQTKITSSNKVAASNISGLATVATSGKSSDLNNDAGFISGITSSDVTTALGFTPYNATNPSGYQANVIETVKVNNTALTPSSKAVNITVPTVTDTYSSTSSDGMSGKAVASAISDITPSSIGAAASTHTHTTANVTALTGYTIASTASAIAATDTLNEALGKLQKSIDGKQASGNYVPTSRTVNGKALTGNITLSASDVSALPDSTVIPTVVDTYSATGTDAVSGKGVKAALDTLTIPTTTDSVTSGSGAALTSGGAYTNLVRRKSTSAATGGANQGVYVDANGQVQTCNATTSTYSSTGTTAVNGTAVASALSSYTPTSRTINSKALTSNITLTASDVGALPSTTIIPTTTIRTWS